MFRFASLTLLCAGASVGGLIGCAVPVDNPPAYAAERDLCAAGNADAYERLVDRCRERFEDGGDCGGVLSFTGQLQGEPLTVDSELNDSEFADFVAADGSETRMDVKLYGGSPYFVFSFEWRGLGGGFSEDEPARSLRFGGGAQMQEQLDDDRVRGALRMTVGGETQAFAPRNGELVIERQLHDEQVASFEAEFAGEGDHLSGCFHAFANKHRLVREGETDD